MPATNPDALATFKARNRKRSNAVQCAFRRLAKAYPSAYHKILAEEYIKRGMPAPQRRPRDA